MTDDDALWLIPLRTDAALRQSFLAYLTETIEEHRDRLESCSLADIPTHRGAIAALRAIERLFYAKEKAHEQRAKYDRATGRDTPA